jgi:hypothetical protein
MKPTPEDLRKHAEWLDRQPINSFERQARTVVNGFESKDQQLVSVILEALIPIFKRHIDRLERRMLHRCHQDSILKTTMLVIMVASRPRFVTKRMIGYFFIEGWPSSDRHSIDHEAEV